MRLNKLFALIAASLLVIAPSCNDDDAPKTPLQEVQGETTGITHNTLTFDWEKVAGATQYGYELFDSNDIIVTRNVTEKTTVTFSDLKPATEYTLKVVAYAAFESSNTTSEPLVLKATTEALKTIGTPVVTVTQDIVKYTATWKKISNAEAYEYVLLNSAGDEVRSGSTTARSVSFIDLEDGDYTLNVKATTTKDGYESAGENGSATFNVKEVFIWQAEGVYNSKLLNKSWNATIKYYGGGNYAIMGWYGVKGYNIHFYIDSEEISGDDYDEDDPFKLDSSYSYNSSAYTYAVPTGLEDMPELYVYPWYESCMLTGNKLKGSVKLRLRALTDAEEGTYTKYANDTFTWEGEDTDASADNYVGSWNAVITGDTFINGGDTAEAVNISETVSFTKVDDKTFSMPALYFGNIRMNVTINSVDRTVTAQPITVDSKYILAGDTDETSQIVGKIKDDGSLEFTDWNVWYDGFVLFGNQKAVYTRK